MNYNDGKWHGWDGENMKPASIHEETVIDYVWFDSAFEEDFCGAIKSRRAGDCVGWSQVLKFRVIREHKEPREFWLVEALGGGFIVNHSDSCGGIHVREVLDDES